MWMKTTKLTAIEERLVPPSYTLYAILSTCTSLVPISRSIRDEDRKMSTNINAVNDVSAAQEKRDNYHWK